MKQLSDLTASEIMIIYCLTGIVALTVGYLLGRLLEHITGEKLCGHSNTALRTKNVAGTCEETALFCLDCDKQLTPYRTDTFR